ncbi:hypothetical protein AKJ43_03415 [candidate division MSBL1 archaeon SCGC-AAA261D19]|uniref:Peptidase S49 domain-containing protein n=1 Tax=candidate division MSBL1 archaeon SCGC-AAA261D19 TaxID=1698273 RepID=A0A133V4Q1_9EURY|nr:hypothetical protein AKJ43_03415 [candidate division MSBL1 archaeon SCGC-AAA261D19]
MSLAYQVKKDLRKIEHMEKLYLLVESGGGDIDSTAKLSKLIKKRCDELVTIVPFYAKSAATLFALDADKLILCESGELGPVDPQVKHPSVDMWFPARSIEEAIKVVEETDDKIVKLSMADKLDPLLLGAYNEARGSSHQYVKETAEDVSDDKRDDFIHTFTDRFRSHGHPIDESICEEVGVNLAEIDDDLEEKIQELHEIYVDTGIELGGDTLIFQTRELQRVVVGGNDITDQMKSLEREERE